MSSFGNYCSSTEAIKFQTNAKFPNELTAIFQKLVDRITEYNQEHGRVTTPEAATTKHLALKRYFDDELASSMLHVIEKNTGLTVRSMTMCLPSTLDNTTLFAVLTGIADVKLSIRDIEGMSSGARLVGTEHHTVKDALKIPTALNKDLGRLTPGLPLLVDVFIPLGVFVVDDFVSGATGHNTVTAAEATSLVLHEIGHVFAYVEYAADISYLGYYGNNILRDVSTLYKAHPRKTSKEIVEISRELQKSHKGKPSQLLSKATQLLDKVSSDYPGSPGNDEPHQWYYPSGLEDVFISTLIKFVVSLMWCTGLLTLPALFTPHDIFSMTDVSWNKDPKRSREYITTKNSSMYERLADEYVSRYKMSKDLNTCLVKIKHIMDALNKQGYGTPIYSRFIVESRILKLTAFMLTWPNQLGVYLLTVKDDGVTVNYESLRVRLNRNISNLVDVLKDRNMDPMIRDSVVKDIDDMRAMLNDHKRLLELGPVERVVKLILRTISSAVPFTWSTLFGTANARSEYLKLFESIDDMLSNKGFHHAAQIASTLEKGTKR